ncbi:MAG: DUF3180 domain-containing protein [Aquiluna sp.]|nr:DUF3180 domain-containing protein [Aquiluna sp.]
MNAALARQLTIFSLVGLIIGLSGAQLTAGFGLAFPSSPETLMVTLVVLGVANYAASYPIYIYRKQVLQAKDGKRPARPNPFYAVRVLILARASTLTGGLFIGWHLGLLSWLVLFSVAPAELVSTSALGLLASLVLLAGGLLSQWNCKSPPQSDADSESVN